MLIKLSYLLRSHSPIVHFISQYFVPINRLAFNVVYNFDVALWGKQSEKLSSSCATAAAAGDAIFCRLQPLFHCSKLQQLTQETESVQQLRLQRICSPCSNCSPSPHPSAGSTTASSCECP